MILELDHLVLGCQLREAGRRALAIDMQEAPLTLGGEHPMMGTHNALMRLGADSYFELIAVNPAAPGPVDGPRWFGLDDPAVKQRLSQGLTPLAWVVRCDDLPATVAALGLGQTVRVCRLTRGALSWDMALPVSGKPDLDGGDPILISWPHGQRPWESMEQRNWQLKQLYLPSALRTMRPALVAMLSPSLPIVWGQGFGFAISRQDEDAPLRFRNT